MQPTADDFGRYLGPDESLIEAYTGKLAGGSGWERAMVGLTDRRLLCLADGERLVTVGYDSISSVQSQSRTAAAYHGYDFRLLVAGGLLLATAATLSAAAVASTLSLLLLLSTLGGFTAAELFRRSTTTPPPALSWLPDGAPDVADRTDVLARDRRTRRPNGESDDLSKRVGREPGGVDAAWVAMTAGGVLGVASVLALVVVSPLLVVLAALAVAGIGAADYASRHREELDGTELVRRQETELRVRTADGRTVHLRTDDSTNIDRQLSRMAFRDEVPPTQPRPVESA